MVKKICHITSVHKRYDTRIFKKQCTTLEKAGYEIVLIVADGKGEETINGVRIISTNHHTSNRLLRFMYTSKSILRKAIDINADIYQIHDPEVIPIGLKLLKKGKKVIFDSHEDFPNQILEKGWIPIIFRKLISIAVKLYYKVNLRKFNAVLSVTPHIVEKLRVIGANVFLITNYPKLEEVAEKNIGFDEYLQRSNNLIYTGTVYETSQQELNLDAISNISDVVYTIVGTIEKKYKDKLIAHSSWNKVNFINFIPKEELNSIYSEATIAMCVFKYSPNLGYKMGTLGSNKLFEYMQHGLPLICTDSDIWKEDIIQKYKCGICVNPYSVKEVSEAINYLIENKKEAFEMGLNAKRAVFDEFNWDTQAKKYIKIIEEL